MVKTETAEAIRNDWLKVGTMLVVSHLLSGGDIQDRDWMMSSLYTLLGFTTYHLVTAKLDTSATGEYKPIADDWMKIGTMLVVSRVLAEKQLNQEWMKSSLFTLLGFTAYHIVTKQIIDTSGLKEEHRDIADDWLKHGTASVTSRALQGEPLRDPTWQREVLNKMLGFNTYDLVVKPTLRKL